MKSLQEFYNDKDTAKNVKNYLIQYLEGEAVRKVFSKEDISGFADAKECIEGAFENLATMFDARPARRDINEAR